MDTDVLLNKTLVVSAMLFAHYEAKLFKSLHLQQTPLTFTQLPPKYSSGNKMLIVVSLQMCFKTNEYKQYVSLSHMHSITFAERFSQTCKSNVCMSETQDSWESVSFSLPGGNSLVYVRNLISEGGRYPKW